MQAFTVKASNALLQLITVLLEYINLDKYKNVTVFWKVDHLHTFHYSRNTNLKY